jgi:hypothetical protein
MWNVEIEEIKDRNKIVILVRYWAVDRSDRRIISFSRRDAAQQFCDLQNNTPPPLT